MACLTVMAMVGVGTAAYFAGQLHADSNNAEFSEADFNAAVSSDMPSLELGDWSEALPLIHASAAVGSEKYSIATGDVSDDSEGLFVLDHNSGLLQCSVIYPRIGQFRARFSINVAEALGTGAKGGAYLMLTGRVQFPRASNRPAASTVVYVMDSATGNYACYGIPFDHTAVARNQPQQGLMVLIATGSANPVIDRDDLR
jgi:hypothetical protein